MLKILQSAPNPLKVGPLTVLDAASDKGTLILCVKQRSRLGGTFCQQCIQEAWAQGYKTFFMLNSAEHEICPLNKSQITNNSKFFLANIAEQENFFAKLAFSYLLAEKFSCSAELIMKKVL